MPAFRGQLRRYHLDTVGNQPGGLIRITRQRRHAHPTFHRLTRYRATDITGAKYDKAFPRKNIRCKRRHF